MKIENKDGLIVIYAEGTNKLTNAEKSFFADFIYLGINDSSENYEEVPRTIWKNFVEEKDPDIDALNEKIEIVENITLDNKSLILNAVDAVNKSCEETTNLSKKSDENTELVLVSLEAISDLYSTIIDLQTQIKILKGGEI